MRDLLRYKFNTFTITTFKGGEGGGGVQNYNLSKINTQHKNDKTGKIILLTFGERFACVLIWRCLQHTCIKRF